MTMSRRNENEDWKVIFNDLSVRYFDRRFTHDQAWIKAQRYEAGEENWIDGLYKESIPA